MSAEPSGWARALSADLTAALDREVGSRVPLSSYSTYRLGGPAEVLVVPETIGELVVVGQAIEAAGVPALVVGRGSNLLVHDAGFAGVAIHLGGAFAELQIGDDEVVAGAAIALPVLARRTAAAGLTGLEFYVGIPGSVGGAVRMNAGGHGRDTAEVLRWASVLTLGAAAEERWSPADIDFGYRRSRVGEGRVVTGAGFTAAADAPGACAARIDEIVRWRREHQPGGANAGSVFTNPAGDSAGRLIDACGLKGYRVGGAVVSDKHANFFLADEGASAADVAQLVADVQARVEDATGIRLHPELTLVGFDG